MAVILPTSAELMAIEADLIPNLTEDRPIFKILPVRTSDAAFVEWEQADRWTGLQQIRGLDGDPQRVTKVGWGRFKLEPGVYGEFERFGETELTEMRTPGTFNVPMNLSTMVLNSQNRLLGRRLDRIEYIGWTLLATGTFSVARGGTILHTDTYPVQTYTASIGWGTSATAVPLGNFRAAQLLGRGHSAKFDAQASAIMNQVTFNNLVSNTNAADLYGRRVSGLATANGLAGINGVLLEDNLPQIVIYEGGYLDDTSTYQLFIPDNKVVLIGRRPGNAALGFYGMTRNTQNPDFAPGPYMKVIDRTDDVPRRIEVHDGHNGGPALEWPSAVIVMNV